MDSMSSEGCELPGWERTKQFLDLDVAQTDVVSRAFRMRLLRLRREGVEPGERDILLAGMIPLPRGSAGKQLLWRPENTSYYRDTFRRELDAYLGSIATVHDWLNVQDHIEAAESLQREISIVQSVIEKVDEIIQIGILADDLRYL